jgi:O-acetylserine/cysteine efflux transporter
MRQLPRVHPATFIAVINLVSFPFIFAASLATAGIDAWKNVGSIDWHVMGIVLAYQVILISLTHIIWQRLLSRNEVARVTCLTLLAPVVAIAISVLLLGLKPTWPLLAGAGLILAGVGFVLLRRVQLHRNEPVAIVE